MSEEILTCSICQHDIDHHSHEGKVYWTSGHNASPVTDGRCCDACNTNVVIPARLTAILKRRGKAVGRKCDSHSHSKKGDDQ